MSVGDKKKIIFELRDKGLMPFSQIASLVGLSRARVHQIYSGYSPNNPVWQKIIKQILARDKNTCQRCCEVFENKKLFSKNLVSELTIHHLDGNDRNNVLTNLVTLCRPCHLAFHHELKGVDKVENNPK